MSIPPSNDDGIIDTRYLLFQPFQCPCASFFNNPLPEAKASAKIQPFSKLPKKIFAPKHSKAAQPLICNNLKQEKNFKKVTTEPKNSPQKGPKKPRQTQNRHTTAQNYAKTELQTEAQKVKTRKHPETRQIAHPFSTAAQKTATATQKNSNRNAKNSKKMPRKQPKPVFRLIANKLNPKQH